MTAQPSRAVRICAAIQCSTCNRRLWKGVTASCAAHFYVVNNAVLWMNAIRLSSPCVRPPWRESLFQYPNGDGKSCGAVPSGAPAQGLSTLRSMTVLSRSLNSPLSLSRRLLLLKCPCSRISWMWISRKPTLIRNVFLATVQNGFRPSVTNIRGDDPAKILATTNRLSGL